MNHELLTYALYLAGIIFMLIVLANAFAVKKLRWNINLPKTEVFFQQIFKVHSIYVVFTVIAMACACFFAIDELIEQGTTMARGFSMFVALFWGSRVVLQFCYYDKNFIRQNMGWSLLFGAAFAYVAMLFLILMIK